MTDKGLNPPALAKILNLPPNAITRYLQGARTPQFDTFIALVDFFDCSADFILGLSEFPKQEGQRFKPTPAFSSQFRTAMKKCNVSQYALQKKTGITWANFNKWLNGIRSPYVDSLIKIANGLDCSVNFLLGRED